MKNFCLLFALLSSWTLHAAPSDVLNVGSPSIVGNTVEVPIFINDRSGTPLGMDRPPGARIVAWAFTVLFSNAEHVQSATFQPSGIASDLPTLLEVTLRPSPGSAVYVGAFSSPPAFTLDAPAPGDFVFNLKLVFKSGTAADVIRSTTYNFTQSERTMLSNISGTVTESLENGFLSFAHVDVAPTPTLRFSPATLSIEGGKTDMITLSSPPSVEPVTIALTSSHPQVIAVPAAVTMAGADRVEIPITPLAAGGPVTITARLGQQTVMSVVTILSPLKFSPSDLSLPVLTSMPFSLRLSSPRSSPTAIRLDISDVLAASLPSMLTIPAGQIEVVGLIQGLAFDRVFVVTATAIDTPNFPVSAFGRVLPFRLSNPNTPGAQVSPAPIPPPLLVHLNTTKTAVFDLGTALGTQVVVTFTSSHPNVLRVAERVTVPPGQKTIPYEVSGVALGSATISAKLPSELGGTTVSQRFLVTANPVQIPTLSGWMLIALGAGLGLIGMFAARTH